MIGTKEAFRHQGIVIGIDLASEAQNKNLDASQKNTASPEKNIPKKKD